MTRYEVGFMNKCAEHGLDAETSVGLMKQAGILDKLKESFSERDHAAGARTGAKIGLGAGLVGGVLPARYELALGNGGRSLASRLALAADVGLIPGAIIGAAGGAAIGGLIGRKKKKVEKLGILDSLKRRLNSLSKKSSADDDYARGFLSKCAEHGLDDDTSVELLKQADLRTAWNTLKGRVSPMLKNYWGNLTGSRAATARALANRARTSFNQNRVAARNLLARLTSGKFDGLSNENFRGLWNRADKYRADAANALLRTKKLRVIADAADKARDATRLGTAIGGAGALGLAGLGYAAGRGSSDT